MIFPLQPGNEKQQAECRMEKELSKQAFRCMKTSFSNDTAFYWVSTHKICRGSQNDQKKKKKQYVFLWGFHCALSQEERIHFPQNIPVLAKLAAAFPSLVHCFTSSSLQKTCPCICEHKFPTCKSRCTLTRFHIIPPQRRTKEGNCLAESSHKKCLHYGKEVPLRAALSHHFLMQISLYS